jgi:hypothetical protein
MESIMTKKEETVEELFAVCREIAEDPKVLDRAVEAMHRAGLIDEDVNAKAVYTAATSRLLEEPVSLVILGESSSGKNHVLKKALDLIPEDNVLAYSSITENSLPRMGNDLKNRVLCVYEVEGLGEGKALTILRTLLTEKKASKLANVPDGQNDWTPEELKAEGPVCFLTTSTSTDVHPELNTRLLVLQTDQTPEHRKRVLSAVARGRNGARLPEEELLKWHAFQQLIGMLPKKVVAPFMETVAELVPPVADRLRRDLGRVRNIVYTSALIHQYSRERDADGNIIATIDDYAVAYEIAAAPIMDSVEAGTSHVMARLISAVRELMEESGEAPMTIKAVAAKISVDESVVSKQVKTAIRRGFLINLEKSTGKPAQLVLGTIPVVGQAILPHPDEVVAAMQAKKAA